MDPIRITRTKAYANPASGKNYRMAWKWHYTIYIPGAYSSSADRLSTAMNTARKAAAPGQPIIRSWIGNMPTGGY